ncbi:DgyrCDS1245 [Dimorphilus gyrociliatus]|uniref:DgyrCDS1245 n=1 Tax=Dimorphilus gyrociliatus TaxID=2664684 RepID=A0A7I8V9K9_9ANNE|nr:DgyrCDS1245 [Dimorphilus gyrociliatus]
MASDKSSGGWWSGWLQAAKDKEFTSTVQRDTVKAASTVKEKISQEEASTIVKQGVSSFISSLKSDDSLNPDDKNNPVIFDQAQSRLSTLQSDKNTYIKPIDETDTEYERFLDSFDIDEVKKDISDLMVNESGVRALYTSLVPSEIPHTVFWQRYFYRLELLKRDERRREELKRRADNTVEKDIAWDDEDEIDFCNDSVKLNEECTKYKNATKDQENVPESVQPENVPEQSEENKPDDTNDVKTNEDGNEKGSDRKEKEQSDSSLDDDWEVDIDVSEEEMKRAEETLAKLTVADNRRDSKSEKPDEDWEGWE